MQTNLDGERMEVEILDTAGQVEQYTQKKHEHLHEFLWLTTL